MSSLGTSGKQGAEPCGGTGRELQPSRSETALAASAVRSLGPCSDSRGGICWASEFAVPGGLGVSTSSCAASSPACSSLGFYSEDGSQAGSSQDVASGLSCEPPRTLLFLHGSEDAFSGEQSRRPAKGHSGAGPHLPPEVTRGHRNELSLGETPRAPGAGPHEVLLLQASSAAALVQGGWPLV